MKMFRTGAGFVLQMDATTGLSNRLLSGVTRASCKAGGHWLLSGYTSTCILTYCFWFAAAYKARVSDVEDRVDE